MNRLSSLSRLSSKVSALGAALLLAACGGTKGGNPQPQPGQPGQGQPVQRTVQIVSTDTRDGLVVDQGLAFAAIEPSTGDLPNAVSRFRAVFTFDLSQIPQGARLVSARLNVYQREVRGLPYDPDPIVGLGGRLLVDHIDTGGVFNNLGNDLWSRYLVEQNIGVLSQDPQIEYKTLNVTTQVQADLTAARTTSQYRVYFPRVTNGDGVEDRAFFVDAEDTGATGNVPLLVITYEE